MEPESPLPEISETEMSSEDFAPELDYMILEDAISRPASDTSNLGRRCSRGYALVNRAVMTPRA